MYQIQWQRGVLSPQPVSLDEAFWHLEPQHENLIKFEDAFPGVIVEDT